jgi:uncharacterized protein YjiS (DUF1127 family)
MERLRIYRLRHARPRRIVPAMTSLLKRLFAAWTAARARTELRSLSDRMLKDIGLSRGQIDSLYR